MRRWLSAICSAAGLLALVAGIIGFLYATPDGLELRWGRLGLAFVAAMAAFVLAWAVAPKQ